MKEQNNEQVTLLIQQISMQFDTVFEENNFANFRARLIENIEYLIHKNPEKLSWILYRVDVNEEFLKQELKENNEQNAAEIIADIMIEREMQKINKGDSRSTDSWSFDVS
jgi:hypothetical protein